MKATLSRKTGKYALYAVLVFALLVMACASTQQQMPKYLGSAQSAVSLAQTSNAEQYAPADLATAQKKLVTAKDMVVLGDRSEALAMAQQATIDAKLAEARAQSTVLGHRVETLQQDVGELRQETRQNQNAQ